MSIGNISGPHGVHVTASASNATRYRQQRPSASPERGRENCVGEIGRSEQRDSQKRMRSRVLQPHFHLLIRSNPYHA